MLAKKLKPMLAKKKPENVAVVYDTKTYVAEFLSFIEESKEMGVNVLSLKEQMTAVLNEKELSKIDNCVQSFWFSKDLHDLMFHSSYLRKNLLASVRRVTTFQKHRQMELAFIVITWIKNTYNSDDNTIRVPKHNELRPIVEKVTPGHNAKCSSSLAPVTVRRHLAYLINELVSI
jgi:hypothetical protein